MNLTAVTNKDVKLGKGWEKDTKIVTQKPFYKVLTGTEVLETSSYENFKCDAKNRPVSEEKIHFFMKQFKQGKFFMKEFPVIVDANMIILDGQHRFEAVKRLGIPLYFRFTDTLSIDNVVDVQINAGWKSGDYLHAFIKQGNQNYIILHRFVERYKINTSVAIALLTGNKTGLKMSGFYEGTFRVKDETSAHEQAKEINKVGEMANGLHKDVKFCMALITMMAHPEYEEKRLVDQIEKYASLMKRQMTHDAYMRNLEEVYNYRLYNKNKVRFI